MRTLSSAQTFLMKAILPPLWILAFGAMTVGVWSGAIPAPGMKWIFPVIWLAGTAGIYWSCIRLKRVELDGSTLVVSNYRTTIRVPLQNVEEVTETRWVNTHPVTLHLRHPSEFGSEIVFMPTIRVFGLWSSHPVVSELRELISRGRGVKTGGFQDDR